MHSHQTIDGTIVMHAHPYDKTADSDPIKTHDHSNSLLFGLDNLDLFVFAVLSLVFVFTRSLIGKFYIPNYSFQQIPVLSPVRGRAPPTF